MKRFLQVSGGITLLSLALTVSLIGWDTHQLLNRLNTTVSQTQQDIRRLSEDLHGTSQNLNAVLIQAGLTSNEVRLAAMEQRTYWAKNSVETHRLLADLDSAAKHADAVISTNGWLLAGNQVRVGKTLDQAKNLTEDLDRTVVHVNGDLYQQDQSISALVENLSKTSGHVEAATSDLARASNDISNRVHDLTRPAKWYVSVGSMVLEKGAEVSQWVIGFFK